ncbi:unnamed protein product [Toxocara canis]|uniref:Uncharacterized protein n=1 Tax=Toxocara canis TaxID=6265 RepID=A0A183UJR6_TOXCA|nr:unnamed protein product [Toxocara canis]
MEPDRSSNHDRVELIQATDSLSTVPPNTMLAFAPSKIGELIGKEWGLRRDLSANAAGSLPKRCLRKSVRFAKRLESE